jgi:cytochrome P450
MLFGTVNDLTTMDSILKTVLSWSRTERILIVTISVIIVWCIINTIRSYRRLSHIPGPFSAHLSKWWMIRATATGEMPFRLADLCQQYGSLVRIGPNDLVTDDAETLRLINGLRSPFLRSDWYSATAFSHDINHAFCERDDEKHAERRTKLIPGYSGRETQGLEEAMDARIEDLCALIERKYLSDATAFRPVDLARICSYFTLEVIHTLAFGTTMGFLERDEDVYGYLRNQKAMLPVFEWLSTLPAIEKFLRTPWISTRIMPKKTDKTGIGMLLKFAEKVVQERRSEQRKDMMGSFIQHGLSDQEAEQEAVLQIIAGSDTTATTIRMILFFIMTNPHVHRHLTEELHMTPSLSTPISDKEAYGMPYLGACIKEGLRMWPPVVGLMSKVVPPNGAEILGKFVPGGTCIGYSAWALHRKEQTFGADASVFRPERWLAGDKDEDQLAEMDKSLDLVFGYGKNACLGKPVAQIEMRKTVAELMRRFEMSIARPEKPFNSVNRNGLFIQNDMLVRFEKRPVLELH